MIEIDNAANKLPLATAGLLDKEVALPQDSPVTLGLVNGS